MNLWVVLLNILTKIFTVQNILMITSAITTWYTSYKKGKVEAENKELKHEVKLTKLEEQAKETITNTNPSNPWDEFNKPL